MSRMLRRFSVSLYRALLRLYPREYRERFAAPMEATFVELCRERMSGPLRALGIWMTEYPALVGRGLAARVGLGARSLTRTRRPRRHEMDDGWWAGLLQDMVHGARMLRRRPMFTAVVVLTLMLGIGLNTAIFSVLYGVLLQPLPFAEPERLLRIGRATPSGSWLNPISPAEFRDLAPRLDQVERLTAFGPSATVWTDSEEAELLYGGQVAGGMFELLGATPQHGRFFRPEDNDPGAPDRVVLADAFWRARLGGDPGVVGSSIGLSGVPHEIIGVGPPGFSFRPGGGLSGAAYWEPLSWTERALTTRHSHWMMLYGRLADGATLESAREELAATWRDVIEVDPGNHTDDSYETGMTAAPLREFTVSGTREPLLFMAGAVALVLAIACVNVANLLLANADSRSHELAVRAALGAGRGRLVRQFLTESLLVTLVGGALGVVLAGGTVRAIVSRFPDAVPRATELGLHLPVLGFAAGVSLLTALLLGAVASLRSSVGMGALRESSGGQSERGSWLRRGLVVAEIALALVLVIGAGLMIKSFWNLRSVDLGFEADRLMAVNLTMSLPEGREGEAQEAFYRDYMERLRALPGIESVAMTSLVPIRNYGRNISGVSPVGDPERRAAYVEIRSVTPGYFETVGVPLMAGRGFESSDAALEAPPVLVNETLARELFDERSPVGARLDLDPPVEIVGVVADMRGSSPEMEPRPYLYVPAAWSGNLLVRARGGEPERLIPQLRRVAREIEPSARIYQAESLSSIVDGSLGSRRFQLMLVSLFASVALALGAIGIYGVMSFLIQGKMRDFGIRLAIGARTRDIRLLVLRSAGTLAAAGLGMGLIGAWALRGWVASLLYEVDPGDPLVYGTVAALLAAVAALACWLPARRASAADPVATLREQ